MAKKFSDIEKTIDRFNTEATECAEKGLGFSALLTAFAIIQAIYDALYIDKHSIEPKEDKYLFQEFVRQMPNKDWFVLRSSKRALSDTDIINDLTQVRHGLTHQLSLPNYIGMSNTISEAQENLRKNPFLKRVIATVEFTKTVEETTKKLLTDRPDISFDSQPRFKQRAPAQRTILQGTTISASNPTKRDG